MVPMRDCQMVISGDKVCFAISYIDRLKAAIRAVNVKETTRDGLQ